MYWLGIYTMIAAFVFAVAGVLILAGYIWSELRMRLHPKVDRKIGIAVAHIQRVS